MRLIYASTIATIGGPQFQADIFDNDGECIALVTQSMDAGQWRFNRKALKKIETTLDLLMDDVLDLVSLQGFRPSMVSLRRAPHHQAQLGVPAASQSTHQEATVAA